MMKLMNTEDKVVVNCLEAEVLLLGNCLVNCMEAEVLLDCLVEDCLVNCMEAEVLLKAEAEVLEACVVLYMNVCIC